MSLLSGEVTGWSKIPQFMQALVNTIEPATSQACDVIVEAAQSAVRVDTSSLKETIDSERVEHDTWKAVWSVNAGNVAGGHKGGGITNREPGSPVDYAVAQEYGPGTHTPYMTPAAEIGWPQFIAILTSRIASLRV